MKEYLVHLNVQISDDTKELTEKIITRIEYVAWSAIQEAFNDPFCGEIEVACTLWENTAKEETIMWTCNECGETCEDEDLKVTKNYSEFQGQPVCEEQTDYACDCGGEFEEAKGCPLCGTYITSDKIVCDECAEDNATVENALAFGENYKTEIALNGFLVYMFPPSVIERILMEVMQNSADKNEQARKFCFEDKNIYEYFLVYKN